MDHTKTHEVVLSKVDPYMLPIARQGEQQFACVLRNRSGMDAGCIDYGLRDCRHLSANEQQDICDTVFALYETLCRQVMKRAVNDPRSNKKDDLCVKL